MAPGNMKMRRSGGLLKSRFLAGGRAALGWPLACLFLGGALWGVTESKLREQQAILKDHALVHSASMSRAYGEQLARSVEHIDQITLNLKHYWKETGGRIDLGKQRAEGLYPKAGLLHVSIIDREGNRVTSTVDYPRTVDFSNREVFQAHQAGLAGLRIGAVEAAPEVGRPVIRFSRGLEAADGSFDGVVVVAAEPAYLAPVTDDFGLGKSTLFAARRSDGDLLAVRWGNGAERLTDDVYRAPPAFEGVHGVGWESGEKFADNLTRLVAWQQIDNYHLFAVVALSEQEILAPQEEQERNYRQFALAGSIMLLLLALVGTFYSFRLAWRKQQDHEVKNAYRLATDGAREGFYMVRPVFAAGGALVDFLVEDCNERGAAFYGTTKANLVGAKFSDFSKDGYLDEVLEVFGRALETGFHEDDVQVLPESPLHAAWIQRRLVRSGDGLAVTLRDITEVKAHEEALQRMANADAVTLLPNRHWLMDYLPTAVETARNGKAMLALLFVDLDDFKNINDTMGHATGDDVLRAVAFRLRSVMRPQDSVVRLGGDEFTVILEGVASDADVSILAARIIAALGEPFSLSGGSCHEVHASIGISMFPRDGTDGDTLLKHADIAMYSAKANGKGQFAFYRPQLSEELIARLNKEQSLRNAVERDEFVLYYQPRVDTFSGELRGLESLVRWSHPVLGVISPRDFIPMAEETGLIVQLGEMVVRKVCMQLAQWKAQGMQVVPVSVNVSPRQFNAGNLGAIFSECMKDYGIDASLIEIEITESCMMEDGSAVAQDLAAIDAMGIRLLVDDFGTGYSSLSQLQRLDLDVLKVDQAFTARLCNGKEGEPFFMAILSMAHVLGMSVVAEGVESIEQLHVLQALSCNEVQGYLISPPVPAGDVPALLRKRFLAPRALEFEAA